MSAARRPRFFVSHEAIVAGRAVLTGDERHHLRVRRLPAGTCVELFDDRGREFEGVIERIAPDRVEVRVTELHEHARESPLELTLALALLKADKIDLVVEKATELGVTRLVLFRCERSLGAGSDRRVQRWRRIAVSAAKQCGRSRLPVIDGPVPFEQLADTAADLRLVCWEGAEAAKSWPQRRAVSSVLIAVGPEGGLTAGEVGRLQRAGFQAISLGPRILRGETAALAALVLAQGWWGDLGGRLA